FFRKNQKYLFWVRCLGESHLKNRSIMEIPEITFGISFIHCFNNSLCKYMMKNCSLSNNITLLCGIRSEPVIGREAWIPKLQRRNRIQFLNYWINTQVFD